MAHFRFIPKGNQDSIQNVSKRWLSVRDLLPLPQTQHANHMELVGVHMPIPFNSVSLLFLCPISCVSMHNIVWYYFASLLQVQPKYGLLMPGESAELRLKVILLPVKHALGFSNFHHLTGDMFIRFMLRMCLPEHLPSARQSWKICWFFMWREEMIRSSS